MTIEQSIAKCVSFIAVLLAFTPKPLPNWMVDSQVLPYAIDASNICAALAPKAIKDAFRESMLDIRKAWEDQLKKKPKKNRCKNQINQLQSNPNTVLINAIIHLCFQSN